MLKTDRSRLLTLVVVTCALFLDGILVSIVGKTSQDRYTGDPQLPCRCHGCRADASENDIQNVVSSVPIFPEYLSSSSNIENETVIKNEGHNTDSSSSSSYQENSLEIGVLLAMKSIAQLMTNPFMGHVTNKFGCDRPLQMGFFIVFFSTLLLALGTSYGLLLIARIVQGIGSSFLNVAGLSMLAGRYTENQEREHAMTYALGGLSLGFLIGAPYAGVVYDYGGKELVFLGVCALALIGACLQYFNSQITSPIKHHTDETPTGILTLIRDPYILLVTVGIFFAHFVLSFLETGLPIWLLDTMHLSPTLLGLAFFPCDISYLLALRLYPIMMQKLERWLTALIGILLMGASVLLLPTANTFIDIILPMAVLGVANGMAETSLMPELAYLVDIRHTSVYGSVYAIGDFAICAALGIGPIICGLVMKVTSFDVIIIGVSILYILFTPFLWLLRNPAKLREEAQRLIVQS